MIKVFKQGTDNQFHFQNEARLEIDVTPGELNLISVPVSLKWTGRLISESKGVLPRDVENLMGFEVKDTRRGSQNWQLTASVIGTTDFSLVWKDEATGEGALDGQVVWTNREEDAADHFYKKSWPEDTGVLLKSEKYLKIGDYSGELSIVWHLNDVATNIE